MTRITSTEIECAHCGHHFKISFEASINTWLDPDLIQKVLDDAYFYNCPSCDKQIHLNTKILINCPKDMFWLDTGLDLDAKKEILTMYGVLDENGEIVRPIMGIDKPSDTHSSKISDVKHIIESFKDNLLKEE